MSLVSIQFGQCGNQIGQKLYSTVYEDLKFEASESQAKTKDSSHYTQILNKWFNVTELGHWEPRSILVDTENKVVNTNPERAYQFKNVIAKSLGGSANNWGFGYSEKSKILQNEVLDAVRTEIEKCDYLTHILNIYSSSGGTGSGVGSRIIEILRDQYPTKTLIDAVVLPYFTGEIVTQSYNTILSLAKLYEMADSTILFQNDELHYICHNGMDVKNITFSSLNNLIAQQISSLYQPLNEVSSSELILGLTSHPSYKFLHIKSTPHILSENLHFESSRNWKSLVDSLSKQSRFEYQQQVKAATKLKKKCVSSALITHGCEKPTTLDLKPFLDSSNYVSWLPKSESCKHFHSTRMFSKLDKYLTVISNDNSIFVPINLIVQDAWNLFAHDAYLHHYEKYGIDKDYFLDTFQTMENILHGYKTL